MNGGQNLNSSVQTRIAWRLREGGKPVPPLLRVQQRQSWWTLRLRIVISSFFVEHFEAIWRNLAWREGCRGSRWSNTPSHSSYSGRAYGPTTTGMAGVFEPICLVQFKRSSFSVGAPLLWRSMHNPSLLAARIRAERQAHEVRCQ